MIKKRNLDPSLIQWIMNETGFGPMVGDIRYVAPAESATSQFRTQLNDMGVNEVETSINTAIGKVTAYRNDVVLVAPGAYAESIYKATLNDVALLGCGNGPDAVTVAPTASHALLIGLLSAVTATMTNSVVKNMTFLTPSTSNPTYAAVGIAYMLKSVIDNCKFKGTTNTSTGAAATIGLQIGNRTDYAWEFHEHCRISNNEFTSNGGRTTQLGIAIHVGAWTQANPEYKGFKSMIIENNIISAKDRGIRLQTGATSCGGTVIRKNAINNQEGGGPGVGIESCSGDGTDMLCMIHDNRIVAINDCILNFTTGNVQGNIVSLNSATPAAETA